MQPIGPPLTDRHRLRCQGYGSAAAVLSRAVGGIRWSLAGTATRFVSWECTPLHAKTRTWTCPGYQCQIRPRPASLCKTKRETRRPTPLAIGYTYRLWCLGSSHSRTLGLRLLPVDALMGPGGHKASVWVHGGKRWTRTTVMYRTYQEIMARGRMARVRGFALPTWRDSFADVPVLLSPDVSWV